MIRKLVLLVTLPALALSLSAGARADDRAPKTPFPTSIALPDGFFPEGIATDRGQAYVGSLIDGAIQQQDLRTGRSTQFAPSPGPDRIAVGMDVDTHGRLWVAGGGPALAPTVVPSVRVYDTTTGALLWDATVNAGFVNDVIVTRDAAWLTDSFSPELIRVPITRRGTIGMPEHVTLGGDWLQAAGFNANGIVASPSGRELVVAQSTAPDVPGAALYAVPADTDATVLEARRIQLDATLAGADGLVLVGRTLYSVAGPAGVVKIRLSGSRTMGHIVEVLAVPGSVTPTTAAVFGARLYVVDAKFPLFGDPTVPFATTAILR